MLRLRCPTSDANCGHECLPQRIVRDAVHEFSADPLLDLSEFFHDFMYRPTASGFTVEGRHAAELAIEMATARRETALAGHVGIRTEQFHSWAYVMVERGKLFILYVRFIEPAKKSATTWGHRSSASPHTMASLNRRLPPDNRLGGPRRARRFCPSSGTQWRSHRRGEHNRS